LDYLLDQRRQQPVQQPAQTTLIGSVVEVNSFLSHMPTYSLHCKTTDMGLQHRTVCLFIPHLSLPLTASTHRGMARLSWTGGLVTYQGGLPVCKYPSTNHPDVQ